MFLVKLVSSPSLDKPPEDTQNVFKNKVNTPRKFSKETPWSRENNPKHNEIKPAQNVLAQIHRLHEHQLAECDKLRERKPGLSEQHQRNRQHGLVPRWQCRQPYQRRHRQRQRAAGNGLTTCRRVRTSGPVQSERDGAGLWTRVGRGSGGWTRGKLPRPQLQLPLSQLCAERVYLRSDRCESDFHYAVLAGVLLLLFW